MKIKYDNNGEDSIHCTYSLSLQINQSIFLPLLHLFLSFHPAVRDCSFGSLLLQLRWWVLQFQLSPFAALAARPVRYRYWEAGINRSDNLIRVLEGNMPMRCHGRYTLI
jgi:hypothetical protein